MARRKYVIEAGHEKSPQPRGVGAFAGGPFDWATPFAVLCGLGLVAGYGLLGATWLVMKTEGSVATRARIQAKLLLLAVLGFMAIVSIWTPIAFETTRWFSLPNILFLWWVPAATALVAFAAWHLLDPSAMSCRSLRQSRYSCWAI